MRDKGIKSLQSNLFGDQYVRINVYIPEELNKDERTRIEGLRNLDNFDPIKKHSNNKGFFTRIKEAFS